MRRIVLACAVAALVVPAAVGGAAPAAVKFSKNTRVNKVSIEAAGEPSTVVDGKGRIHVAWHGRDAAAATPLGRIASWCARSDDNGLTWSDHVKCDVSGTGNGDPWLATDPKNPDHLYYASLNFLATAGQLSQSRDGGKTWTTAKVTANTGVDREWVTVAPDGTVYYAYHDIGPEFLYIASSTDEGSTWQPGGGPITTGYPVNTNVEGWPDLIPNTNQGPPQIDPTDSSRILYPYLTSTIEQNTVENQNLPAPWGDLSNVNIAVSIDGGITWVNRQIFTGPEHTNAAYALPWAAIDQGGIMYVAFVDNLENASRWNLYIMRSFDHGETWESKPLKVATGLANTTMPHIVAGSKGRIGLAYYGSGTKVRPTDNDTADWNVYYSSSLNADNAVPTFETVKVSDHTVHHGRVCPLGLACENGRDLHDLFDLRLDQAGGVNIPWTDTSTDDKKSAGIQSYVGFACQTSGPSLYASKGSIAGRCNRAAAVQGASVTKPAPGTATGAGGLPATGIPDSAAVAGGAVVMIGAGLLRRSLRRSS